MARYTGDMLAHYFSKAPPHFTAIAHFGDAVPADTTVPIMAKARRAASTTDNGSSILSLIGEMRHYKHVNRMIWLPFWYRQTRWEHKKDTLIWRGTTTGVNGRDRIRIIQQYIDSNVEDIDVAFDAITKEQQSKVPSPQAKYVPPSRTIRELLRYKYLLSLEGNDVSSGLKWMLYSNSVVLMPKPYYVSFAMEDKLVPFYHYIPLNDDASNLPEMLEWARNHEEECQQIALRATEYMKDLYASKQARRDNEEIFRRMVKRYQDQYMNVLWSCGGLPPSLGRLSLGAVCASCIFICGVAYLFNFLVT